MRTALDSTKVTASYNQVARWYECQHSFLTGGTDQRGRELVVEHTVRPNDAVLDAGAGTGGTSLLAAEKSGPDGQVVLLDASERMLEVAAEKAEQENLQQRIRCRTGEMLDMPFGNHTSASMNESLSTSAIHIGRFFADLFLGAVFTNAQASIRGAALLGARHEAKFKRTPPFRLPWVSHLAARSGGAGVVLDCCEVGAKRRLMFSCR